MSKVEKWKSGKPPPTLHPIFFEKAIHCLKKFITFVCLLIRKTDMITLSNTCNALIHKELPSPYYFCNIL